jgi:hypothetical protein
MSQSLAGAIPQRKIAPFSRASAFDVAPRMYLRPSWVEGRVPYVPSAPVPRLGEPIAVGDFLLWPDAQNRRAFYSPLRPLLRQLALVVYRTEFAVEGGSSFGVTSGNVVITVSVYADADTREIDSYKQEWTAELARQGVADADLRFLPLRLRELGPHLALPAQELAGEIQALTSFDAGTVTFMIPLSQTGATNWQQKFSDRQGNQLVGGCSVTASYFAQADSALDVDTRVLSCDIGTLLADAEPTDLSVVNPQMTAMVRAIVSAHELVDAVTIDVAPTEGALPQSLAFTNEGGQLLIPVTSAQLRNVQVPYKATVRYTPPGWPVITQQGSLTLPIDLTILVKPDSWIRSYTVCVMMLDSQNKVTPAESVDVADTLTVRLDYLHPALPAPLSLVFQARQELITVPFPQPPDSAVPPTLQITVLGQRAKMPAGPKIRVLNYDETLIMVKVFINGAIEIITNKDATAETSLESDLLRVLAHVG